MPFTLAHPAAILPLRRALWFPGLVAGSIAPDIPYYIPVGAEAEFTHSLLGLPLDLILGMSLLILAWLVHRPLLALLGKSATPPRTTPWRATLAIPVGALTHLAWDSFTHTNGIAVRHWEILRESVIGPHRVYNVFGYISSAAGVLILTWYAARWYRASAPAPPAPQRNWILTGLLLAAVIGALLASSDPIVHVSLYDCVRHLLVAATQGAVLTFTAWAAVHTTLERTR
ncbi:MAG: hypothetical protein JWN03_2134 [Nocardia sp.]|uniref:DUF4184 family protein n=1 Tax=Nocardia sp. TaxID=1821 RepID=UPI00262A9333|nr:DUF4184 family protein [Nocardia sp.]MCU1641859.1 hypothetical protein [Nocardia sp.]